MRSSALVWMVVALSSASGGPLFFDDFQSGASPLWGNERGSWFASGGVYDAQFPQNLPPTYSSLPYDLHDFRIELDVNAVQNGGIWLRADAQGRNGVVLGCVRN